MKRLLAVCMVFLSFTTARACDTYDPITGQLSIPLGVLGTTVYTNVVITIGNIVAQNAGTGVGNADIYTPQNNELQIPCVAVGNLTFNGVINVARVISVGGVFPAPSSGAPVLQLVDPLPDATVGTPYRQNVVAGIFPDPLANYTISIDTLANGVLPTGMTLDMNGILSGTPFATGKTDVNGGQLPNYYKFGVCATNIYSRLTTSPCPQTSLWVNPQKFTLTIDVAGNGTVSTNPPGLTYGAGERVTLVAAPGSGSTFAGWSGACSGTGSCTVTMSANEAVTATFTSGGNGSGYYYANYNCGGQSGCIADFGYNTGSAGPFCSIDSCNNWLYLYFQGGTCTASPQYTITNAPPAGTCA